MSIRIRASALVALICLTAGCAAEPDPGPLNAVASELADAQDQIAKLKSELLRTKLQLHDAKRKSAEAETKTFNAIKAQHDETRERAELNADQE